ncbi:5'-methylthioadenosine/S-adenosylhomocysteine nucleosidase [Allorhizocola rhizosphaerae]|uniref:5'-methylthioadenosine/S-adenosylhomocysteine nucleosidase n=1 Tax=Allorhizocola rhizosphaerae TaxID=1872709 RepID=UPI0013C2FFD7|nr:5'-methylthioadenosine/S-adenosylhomocysteine nucleosidase [Allorhizocola rhizosphaerae]
MRPLDVTIGIVTALPIESAAARLVIDDLADCAAIPGDPNVYKTGALPSLDKGRPHRVVLALQTEDGTRNAAAMCSSLARSFPQLKVIVMCGIAGGIPAPHDPRKHVRLGDVVVATGGIVDYNHVRLIDGVRHLRRATEGMSRRLLAADHELEIREHLDNPEWVEAAQALRAVPARFARPAESTDVLTRAGVRIPHPDRQLSGHRPGIPRVHRGPIGSADVLVRDEAARDLLAAEHGILAVEMEGSGIAVGAGLHDVPWFVVRGMVDYCANATKNDVWHAYSAWVAAAYTRALLGQCHSFAAGATRTAPRGVPGGEHLRALIDALSSVRVLRDDAQRRAVLAVLPHEIVVPDNAHGRLHIISLVHACADHDGGREALLDALELILGPGSRDFQRVREAFDAHW